MLSKIQLISKSALSHNKQKLQHWNDVTHISKSLPHKKEDLLSSKSLSVLESSSSLSYQHPLLLSSLKSTFQKPELVVRCSFAIKHFKWTCRYKVLLRKSAGASNSFRNQS